MINLALFEPDIPQNCGTILRLCACLGVCTDIIEPCGFVLSDARLKRAGLDYISHAHYVRHRNFSEFRSSRTGRIILLTTKATQAYTDFNFLSNDSLLFGSESRGVPDEIHDAVDARLCVPLAPEMRSLNVAVCAGLVLGEALRQTGGFPGQNESTALTQENFSK